MIKTVVISSAHGKFVRGAKGYIDEVDESRRVVAKTADYLRKNGAHVTVFHDDVSKTVSSNLARIVSFHDSQKRDLDVSIHFNATAGGSTSRPIGTECLYLTQFALAKHVAAGIAYASAPLIDRGAKKRTNLAFLKTKKPSILVEVCFVNSKPDADAYRKDFDKICKAIADAIRPA